eukprot:3245776-Alexandrium_andersonii.AAC.1
MANPKSPRSPGVYPPTKQLPAGPRHTAVGAHRRDLQPRVQGVRRRSALLFPLQDHVVKVVAVVEPLAEVPHGLVNLDAHIGDHGRLSALLEERRLDGVLRVHGVVRGDIVRSGVAATPRTRQRASSRSPH